MAASTPFAAPAPAAGPHGPGHGRQAVQHHGHHAAGMFARDLTQAAYAHPARPFDGERQHAGHPGDGRAVADDQRPRQRAAPLLHAAPSAQSLFDLAGPAAVFASSPVSPVVGPPEGRKHGHLSSRFVPNPPNLEEWREKLFHVDGTVVMTNDEFETYFPHIDNVYSHRSTQQYKRKPFISHYWDCRMKGRPPGTPKSEDPNKKKRKRSARERDLCDVKIKITEYLPGMAMQMDGDGDLGVLGAAGAMHPGVTGQRFWTVQRVNGAGKGDGSASTHKHSLAKSDEIKKSSVQRFLAHQERDTKKIQKSAVRRPSGKALVTAKKHAKDSEIKLYSACFCPFSQRVWIALEAKGLSYQYCEIDPFKRPQQLLDANPRGLVPAIRQGDWACGESAVILEYLEDVSAAVPLYPREPRLRANCRLWIDHINSRILPAFYGLLRATESIKQKEMMDMLQLQIRSLTLAADEEGPFFLGSTLCLVDVHLAPFALRLSRILKPSWGWADAAPGPRWQRWLDALEHNGHVQATTSSKELYTDTVDLLVQNSPVLV